MFDPYPEFFDVPAAEKAYAKFVTQSGLDSEEMYVPGVVVPAVFHVHDHPHRKRGEKQGKGGTVNCGMLIIGEGNYRCVRTIAEAVMTAKLRGFEGVYVITENTLYEELQEIIELDYPDRTQ